MELYDKEELKKVQKTLLKLAIATRDILEANNIPYFITYGTLLGAVRHKGFIPWDDDFDYYLFEDSYEDAMDALRKGLPEDMFLEFFDSEPMYFHAWAHVKDLKSERDCVAFPVDAVYKHHGISIDLYRTKRIREIEEKLYRTDEHIKYLNRRKKLNLIEPAAYNERMNKLLPIYEEEKKKVESFHGESREIYATNIIYDDRLYPEELFPLKKYEFEGELFYGPNNADVLLRLCYGDYMQLPPEDKRVPHNMNVRFL